MATTDDRYYVQLGRNIRAERVRLGMHQPELAKAIGVAPGTLSAYERGKRRASPDTLEHIARALRVPSETLLPGVEVVQAAS